MRFSYAVVTADKSRQRDGLRSGKGGIPTGAVFNGLRRFPVCILIFVSLPVLDELAASNRMLSFG
jgi:hypothetical protein